MKKGECHLAPVHLLDPASGHYNAPLMDRYRLGDQVVLVKGVRRVQGLMVPRGNPDGVTGLGDLIGRGLPFVNRQRGRGPGSCSTTFVKKRGSRWTG